MRMLFVVDDTISQEYLLKQISRNFSKKKKSNLGHQVSDQHSSSQLTLPRKKKNLSKNGLRKDGVRKNPVPDSSSLPSISAACQKNLPLSLSGFTSRNGILRKIRGGRKTSVSSSEDDLDFESEDCDKEKAFVPSREGNNMKKQKRYQINPKRKRKQCEILKEKLKESFLCSDKEESSVTMKAECNGNGRENVAKLSGSDMSVKKKQKILKKNVDNKDTGNEKHNSDVVEEASVLSSFSSCDKKTIQSKSLNQNGITKDCHNGLNGQVVCSLTEENNNFKSLSVSQTAGGNEYLIDSRRKNNSDYLSPKLKQKRKAENLQATNKKIKVEKLISQNNIQTCRVTGEAEMSEEEYSICGVGEKNGLKTRKATCRLTNDTQMSEKTKVGLFSKDEKSRLKNKKSTWDGESCLYLRNLFDQNKAITGGSGIEENDILSDDGIGFNYDPDHLCDMESVQTSDSASRVSDEQSSEESPPVGIYIPDWVYVAVDCEMVGVGPKGKKSVLARCSIVDYEGKVLYDEYVRPNETITDYRTPWSGIRPKHMSTAIPIDEALIEIEACLSNKIIIGHSVYHDFRVLGLRPEYYFVRDTAQCRQLVEMAGIQGRGNGLKKLSEALLDRHIQVGRQGHCSVEDARATLDLFKLVRKTWEPELYTKWMKKEPALASKITLKVEDARKNSGNVFEDFLQDKFWPCHVME